MTGTADATTILAADGALAAKLPISPKAPGRRRRPALGSGSGGPKPAGRREPGIPAPDQYGIHFDDPDYITGTDDPIVIPDPGAGTWNSKPKTYSAIALKLAIQAGLGPITNSTIGFNATRHMSHYLSNSGLDLKIDLENMVRTVPSARDALILEFRQAQRFLQGLLAGRYDFTSKKQEGAYNEQGESRDWYFAIGGYALWGKGRAQTDGVGPTRRYDVDFIYKVADRYNWDGGKEVEIGGITITDEFMGEFHRQGLAKEFDCNGSLRRRFQWSGDVRVPPDAMILRAGGR